MIHYFLGVVFYFGYFLGLFHQGGMRRFKAAYLAVAMGLIWPISFFYLVYKWREQRLANRS